MLVDLLVLGRREKTESGACAVCFDDHHVPRDHSGTDTPVVSPRAEAVMGRGHSLLGSLSTFLLLAPTWSRAYLNAIARPLLIAQPCYLTTRPTSSLSPTMSTARSTAGAPDATVTHEKSGISPTASGLKKNEDVEADVRSIHSDHFQHTELARGLKVSSTPGYRSRVLALARSPSLSDWFLLLGSEGWGRTRR